MPKKPRRDAPPTFIRPVLLARVSTDEQAKEGYSLDEQVRRMRAYCQEHFHVDVPDEDIVIEDGVSGRPGQWEKRPKLKRLIEACEAGKYTHLVVFKLDRLGRNVKLMSDALEHITDANVLFVSLMDSVDASTASGRLYITIFLAVAQWFSDNLSDLVIVGKEGRRRAGLPNGKYPYGSMPHEQTGIPLPDTRPLHITGRDGTTRHTNAYEGLYAIFRWCADGLHARAIADRLNEQGYRTGGTHPDQIFARSTVQQILENRFYLGEIKDGKGGYIPGKHAPLISQDLWDAAESARLRHRKNPQTIPGNAKKRALGGGLLICGDCWAKGAVSAMHIQPGEGTHSYRYRCSHQRQGYGCTSKGVAAALLEPQVTWLLRQFVLPEADQARMSALYEQVLHQERPTIDIPAQMARLESREKRLRQLYEWGDLTDEDYGSRKREIRDERATLQQQQRVAPDASKLIDISGYIGNMAAAWEDAEAEERYELARLLFNRLWVHERRIVAFEPTEELAPYFMAADRIASHPVDFAVASWLSGNVHQPLSTSPALPQSAIIVSASYDIASYERVKLTPEQRQAIVTRRLGGESVKVLASEYAITANYVRTLMYLARRGGAL